MQNLRLWKSKVIQMLNIFMMRGETETEKEEETGTEIVTGTETETVLPPGKTYSEIDGVREETAGKETEKGIEKGREVETEIEIVTEKEKRKEEMWKETEEIGTDKD